MYLQKKIKVCINPLSRIHNTSFTSAYFGLDKRECESLEHLFTFIIRLLMTPSADYSETKLINVANSELADTLGNLASRCCGSALNPRGEFPPLHACELAVCRHSDVTINLLDHVERLPGEFLIKYSAHSLLNSS
jgi:methionyl-tRNA synthetase